MEKNLKTPDKNPSLKITNRIALQRYKKNQHTVADIDPSIMVHPAKKTLYEMHEQSGVLIEDSTCMRKKIE